MKVRWIIGAAVLLLIVGAIIFFPPALMFYPHLPFSEFFRRGLTNLGHAKLRYFQWEVGVERPTSWNESIGQAGSVQSIITSRLGRGLALPTARGSFDG